MAVLATAAVLFFAHYSGGDWMDAYRWLGLAAVPLMILLADASTDLAIASRSWPIPRFTRGRLWIVPAGVALVMGVVQTHRALVRAETSPYDVHRRVTFIREAQKRLGLEHTTAMDVDMGAHMWWSGMDIVDMAGLIDVPMGHHKPNKRLDPFIAEYIFEERRPEFAHVHGNWAKRTQIPSHPAWRSDYVDIGAFPISPWTHHVGSHVRRDTFVADAWDGPSDRAVPFSSGIALAGWLTPATTIATDAPLRLEVGWTATGRKRDFRAYVFLASDDALLTHELPPGYDWLPPDDWKPDEVVLGRHSIPTTGLPPGTYDLGFALTDPETGFRAPLSGPAGTQRTEPRFARGEIRWTDVVEIVEPERARALADVGLERTVATARIGECAGAEDSWNSARRHLSPEAAWQVAATVTAQDALALCWARRAETEGSADAIDRARQWNHREAEVLRIGSLLADRWQAEGEVALAEERLDDAHASWRDALIADPSRAWLMRRLETLRTERLGLERPKR